MRKVNRKKELLEFNISKYTIDNDSFDKRTFKEVLDNSQRLKEIQKRGTDMYEPYKELNQDVFDAFYKYDVSLLPENTIDNKYLLNYEIMKEVLESQKYKELRSISKLDQVVSAVGTEVMSDELVELIKKLKEEYEKAMQQLQAAQDAMDKAGGQGNGTGADGSGDGEGNEESGSKGGKGKDDKKISYKEAQKKLEEAKKTMKDVLNKEYRRDVQNIVSRTLEQAIQTSELISNWGLTADPSYSNSGYQEKAKLLERLRNSEKLKRMADKVGRFINLAVSTQREKVKKGINEVYNIKPGNDLAHTLPSELMNLNDPVTEMLFLKDLTEGKVLNYDYFDKEKKQRGPIIACIDSSGSMSGDPEIWAKAVALGLLEIAKRQKRSFAAIHFSSGYAAEKLHKNIFPKNKPKDMGEVLDLSEYCENGGTEFEPPLKASQLLIDGEGDFSKADVVFITDGEAAVRENWLRDFIDWKKKKNVSIYSVLIDCTYNSSSCIKTFSNQIFKLSDLKKNTAETLAKDLFTLM